MPVEDPLRAHYQAHRDACVLQFVDALRRSGIAAYRDAPEAALTPAVGKSMDLLIECVLSRQPERYVQAQRDLFAQRVKAGVPVGDILEGLDPAQATLDALMRQAYPDAPADCATMTHRAQRYLLMARTALVTLMSEHR